MFGNVKPAKSQMTIGQYTDYRAYYCGLCKSMGKRYAGLCNLGLSYEAVFIAIIVSAMSDDAVYLKRQRCIVHPFTKSPMVVHNSSVDKAAALNVLLLYNKIKDDIRDDGGIISRLAKIWFKRPYTRAAREDTQTDSIIASKLDELNMLEEGLCDVIDMAAQPFAEMMGELALKVMPDGGNDIYWFGFFMGKWLWVIDAFADIKKDHESNSYNPFILANKGLTADDVIASSRDDAQFLLEGALTEIGRLYDKLPIKRNKEILENIIFVGMPKRTQEVLSGQKPQKPKGEYLMQ